MLIYTYGGRAGRYGRYTMAKSYGRKGKGGDKFEKVEPLAAPKAWGELLQSIIDQPGVMNAAFSAFHSYSLGNVLLAWAQLVERELPLGPIATYRGWQAKGRQVRKGEQSIILCQP